MSAPPTASRRRIGWIGLAGGPLLGLLVYVALPDTFADQAGELIALGHAGRATAALATVMAVWWMTEAIEIPATALLPVAALPLLGAATANEAAAPYANPLIFLFLGGFLLALAMQRWGLERRIAHLALGLVGTEPRRVVGGFMVLTAVLSMWVSNTATVAMVLPIALSVIDAAVPGGRDVLLRADRADAEGRNFARSLLFGIALSASIGGVGTLIGTPPNLFLASFARDTLGREIGFAEWLLVGLPMVAVLLPIAWVLLTFVLFPPDVDGEALADTLERGSEELEPMSAGEWATLIVFSCAATAWVTRPFLEDLTIAGGQPFANLTDPGIAVLAGLALFIIPVERATRTFVLDWDSAVQLPWGILLLFGGGLSLAAAIEANAVAEYLGTRASALEGLPPILLVAIVAAGVVFLTELTSNTATAAALVPILAAVAPGLGLDPLALAFPAAVAASLAFMLPVATPPNAIVFGSGLLTIPEMVRVGVRLNLASIVVITVASYVVAAPVLGFDLTLW
jgi:solute carrier family 13 (sodium-dependent dicarboxylate transporter), member 2/3/5